MSRQVTGTLSTPEGSALSGQQVRITAKRNYGTEIAKSVNYTFTTDTAGGYDVTLENGSYSVYLVGTTTVFLGDISVETNSATDLISLLTVGDVSNPLTGTIVTIANGGTGATSAAAARTNLDVYSTGEIDTLLATTDGGTF